MQQLLQVVEVLLEQRRIAQSQGGANSIQLFRRQGYARPADDRSRRVTRDQPGQEKIDGERGKKSDQVEP